MDANDQQHCELDPPPNNHEEQIVMAAMHPVTLRKYLMPAPSVTRASERAVSRIPESVTNHPSDRFQVAV